MDRVLDKTRQLARGFYSDFINLLAPPVCIGCGVSPADDDPIFCRECLSKLKHQCRGFGPVCPFCGGAEFKDDHCEHGNSSINIRLYYWGRYKDDLIRYILSFKFDGAVEVGKRLSEEAAICLAGRLSSNNYDYIIPVPLYRSREYKRQFNQSELIGNVISDLLKVDLLTESVMRVRNTRKQSKIDDDRKRWVNVRDAFCVTDDYEMYFEGKRVLIVDDIVTTGATVFETAKPVMKQNPEMLDIFCLAYAG